MKMFNRRILEKIDECNEHIRILELAQSRNEQAMIETAIKIQDLLARKPDYLSAEEKARIADLEVKLSKLWTLLTTQTPARKEDKLNIAGQALRRKM